MLGYFYLPFWEDFVTEKVVTNSVNEYTVLGLYYILQAEDAKVDFNASVLRVNYLCALYNNYCGGGVTQALMR